MKHSGERLPLRWHLEEDSRMFAQLCKDQYSASGENMRKLPCDGGRNRCMAAMTIIMSSLSSRVRPLV